MTNTTDPQSIIRKTRDLCKAATPGPLRAMNEYGMYLPDDVLAVGDREFFAAAPTMLLELAEALQSALQYKSQLVLAFDQHLRTQRELADLKSKMVDLLADAYDKGRRFSEDTDDRTSEHD